jgi:RNA polymerase sigma factor (sigma-70 family)
MSVSSVTPEGPASIQPTLPAVPAGSNRCDEQRAHSLMLAIEGVYKDRFSTFHRVASAITGDPELGRDAVQEAFARAIRRRMDFRGDGPLEGWLWRTVINVAKDHCRMAKGTVQTGEMIDLPDPSDRGPAQHHDELIRQRVASLPDRQRVALFLRYYVDMSYAEIGEALDIRTGTVSATLNAAHKALRSSLEGVLGDDLPVATAAPQAATAVGPRRRARPELPVSVCMGAREARRPSAAG